MFFTEKNMQVFKCEYELPQGKINHNVHVDWDDKGNLHFTEHDLGNGVKTLLESKVNRVCLEESNIGKTIEEILRFDPPLHMFTRYAYEDVHLEGHSFKRGDEVALMLGAAGRDPKAWDSPEVFLPTRPIKTNTAFGGGIHFCVGAPLARLELLTAIPILFEKFPKITLIDNPLYSNLYHFHGLCELNVSLKN